MVDRDARSSILAQMPSRHTRDTDWRNEKSQRERERTLRCCRREKKTKREHKEKTVCMCRLYRSPVNWPWLRPIQNVPRNVPKLESRKHLFFKEKNQILTPFLCINIAFFSSVRQRSPICCILLFLVVFYHVYVPIGLCTLLYVYTQRHCSYVFMMINDM